MTDQPIHQRINQLAHEEEELWQRAAEGGGGLDLADQARLEAIAVELDQCFDLLHQRQAKREYGLDPREAKVRSPEVVERYQQ